MKLRTALLLIAAPYLGTAAEDSRLRPPVRQIQAEVKPDEAMAYMRVYATDRWFTFPKFEETTEYLKRTMNEIGLSDVEVLAAPADGVTQYGFHTMPLAWDAAPKCASNGISLAPWTAQPGGIEMSVGPEAYNWSRRTSHPSGSLGSSYRCR